MAGDWIKMEHATPDKPEVWRMSALLKIPPEQVVGHLLRVWIWADQQSVNVEDGGDAYVDVDVSTVDAVARLQGFGAAMLQVKWLQVSDGRVTFPGLQSFISESAKIRALKNRAQQKWRAKVDGRQTTNRPQKEEKSSSPLVPPTGGPAQRARKPRNPKSNGNGQAGGPLTDLAIQALGIKYGIAAQPGESADAYRARILAEDRRRHDE